MTVKKILTIADLHKVLVCDAKIGKLFWRERPAEMFLNDKMCSQWNDKYSGAEAISCVNSYGYLTGRCMGHNAKAHRVIWAMVHGDWPNNIDHINHDRSDNRIENLRNVEHLDNCRNQSLSLRNKSGTIGVSWYNRTGQWLAQITSNKVYKNLGLYDDKQDAIIARKKAEAKFGFHKNHGMES